MRIFLIAASEHTRARLGALLESRGVEVSGSAADLESGADELADLEADAVLVSAANQTGEDLLEWLEEYGMARENAASRVVLGQTRASSLSGTEGFPSIVALIENVIPSWVSRALRAGVRGILPEDASPDVLVSGLEAVAKGLVVLAPEQSGSIRPARAGAGDNPGELLEPLTAREKEVLQMLASGLGNKQIAAKLKISEHTAKFHVGSILGKLGANSRTEAVTIGMRRGLILL